MQLSLVRTIRVLLYLSYINLIQHLCFVFPTDAYSNTYFILLIKIGNCTKIGIPLSTKDKIFYQSTEKRPEPSMQTHIAVLERQKNDSHVLYLGSASSHKVDTGISQHVTMCFKTKVHEIICTRKIIHIASIQSSA